jgi:hypothetical protein
VADTNRIYEADYYATKGQVPPWIVEACDQHLGDLLRYHERGHGEMHMRPLWARKGVKHGTTEEDGAYAREKGAA